MIAICELYEGQTRGHKQSYVNWGTSAGHLHLVQNHIRV